MRSKAKIARENNATLAESLNALRELVRRAKGQSCGVSGTWFRGGYYAFRIRWRRYDVLTIDRAPLEHALAIAEAKIAKALRDDAASARREAESARRQAADRDALGHAYDTIAEELEKAT